MTDIRMTTSDEPPSPDQTLWRTVHEVTLRWDDDDRKPITTYPWKSRRTGRRGIPSPDVPAVAWATLTATGPHPLDQNTVKVRATGNCVQRGQITRAVADGTLDLLAFPDPLRDMLWQALNADSGHDCGAHVLAAWQGLKIPRTGTHVYTDYDPLADV